MERRVGRWWEHSVSCGERGNPNPRRASVDALARRAPRRARTRGTARCQELSSNRMTSIASARVGGPELILAAQLERLPNVTVMSSNKFLVASFAVLALARFAHAEDAEVDVKSFEYVDVVETTDGSVWKGVIVEQSPGVQYKIATADGSLHVLKAGDVTKLSK